MRRRIGRPIGLGTLVAASMATIVLGCGDSPRLTASPDSSPGPTPARTLAVGPGRTSLPMPSRTYASPESLDASGAMDVSDAMQAFVDGVPDNSRITFPTGSVFRLDRGISLDDRHDLYFEGSGSTLLLNGCEVTDSAFLIGASEASSGIVIRDFTFVGANADSGTTAAYHLNCEFQMGVAIYQSSNIEITDVIIQRAYGDCVYVGGKGDPVRWSDNIWFHDSRCGPNGRMGVAVTAGSKVDVERVAFDAIAMFPFDIEPNDAGEGATNILFADNTIGTYTLTSLFSPYFFIANGAGAEGAPVENVTVSGNLVTGGTLRANSQEPNRKNIAFVNNRSMVPARGPVLTFRYVDGLTVSGNVQPLVSGSLVAVSDSENVTVK